MESTSKFATDFEILNPKKSLLQNPVDLTPTCTSIPVVFPHTLQI
jgi:hypothetical protein